jgi:mevalonate kinase
MADLQYGDVQRAVQDGLRQIQSDLQRLVNDMQRAVQQIQYTDETMKMVQDIQRMLQQNQPSLDNIHRKVTDANSDQRIALMHNDIQELKNRFSAVERFAGQMSEYIRQQHDGDREDREYRQG